MDFTQLAMQKLNQTAPELVNNVVAFRDITEESSSESDVAVGAFVLQSGASFYYIPVIQKDQSIHPIDSVFFCDTGKFRPLTKSVVNQILNTQKLEPGRTTKIPGNITRNPSVYELVTPPRTGKYAYASSSRSLEFLAAMPNHLKAFVRTQVRDDSPLMNGVHKMYGIEDFMSALKETQFENKEVMEAPAKAVLRHGDALDEAQAREVLEKGYTLNQSYPHASRVAIPQEEFEYHGQLHERTPSVEQGRCFRMVTPCGGVTQVYVLKKGISTPVESVKTPTHAHPYSAPGYQRTTRGLVISESGRVMKLGRFLSLGDELVGTTTNHEVVANILRKFTDLNPLGHASSISNGSSIVVLSPDMTYLAEGFAENVTSSSSCTTVRLRSAEGTTNISFVQGLKSYVTDSSGVLCVPYDYPVIAYCGSECDAHEIERININAAQAKQATNALVSLGDKLKLSFDGIHYAVNGKVVGNTPSAIEVLIVREGIDPNTAESIVKRASETKSCVVLMSKKADFEPGEMPEFGVKPQPQSPAMGAQRVTGAVETGDKQVADAMIISELLQSPDLMGLVSEYVPEIGEAVDKLGRILFLSRVRMDQLIQANGSEAAMSTIASIKAVYRNLGDNLVKLEQLVTNVSAT